MIAVSKQNLLKFKSLFVEREKTQKITVLNYPVDGEMEKAGRMMTCTVWGTCNGFTVDKYWATIRSKFVIPSLSPNTTKLLFPPTTCTKNTDIQLLLIGFAFSCIVNATLLIQGNQLPSGIPNFL